MFELFEYSCAAKTAFPSIVTRFLALDAVLGVAITKNRSSCDTSTINSSLFQSDIRIHDQWFEICSRIIVWPSDKIWSMTQSYLCKESVNLVQKDKLFATSTNEIVQITSNINIKIYSIHTQQHCS